MPTSIYQQYQLPMNSIELLRKKEAKTYLSPKKQSATRKKAENMNDTKNYLSIPEKKNSFSSKDHMQDQSFSHMLTMFGKKNSNQSSASGFVTLDS